MRRSKFPGVSLAAQLLPPLNDASPPFPRREMETLAEEGSKAICRKAGRGSGKHKDTRVSCEDLVSSCLAA